MARETFGLWEEIFRLKAFDTTQDLHFITPDEIKALVHKEPRIMAKMDSTSDVPPVFKQHGYFLLSVGKLGYAIVRGEGFHKLEQLTQPSVAYQSRITFNLTTADRGTAEMQYLDYCANAGLIEHFIGEGTLYPSIRGREGSGAYDFQVGTNTIAVASAQVEVDLGLEGENCIVLLEAKSKTPEDFIIRQLYYPYRRFRAYAPHKKIMPVFFTYEAKTKSYNFWLYAFTNDLDYNSLQLVRSASYTIVPTHTVKLQDLQPEGNVVYKDLIPQANDLDKVMQLVFKVGDGDMNAATIAEYLEFNPRQSSYYSEAAEALGLLYREGATYRLTETGQHTLTLPVEDRNLFLANLLTNFHLISYGLAILKQTGHLTKTDLEKLIADNSDLTGTTIPRRAASLWSWFKWMSEKTGAFTLNGHEYTKTQ